MCNSVKRLGNLNNSLPRLVLIEDGFAMKSPALYKGGAFFSPWIFMQLKFLIHLDKEEYCIHI